MTDADPMQSSASAVSPHAPFTAMVAGTGVAPIPGAKEVWMVSRAGGDSEGGPLKPLTDLMTASAALLWPLIAIVVAWYLRDHIRLAASALVTRIQDPTQDLKWGPVEFSRRIQALESQVESGRVESQVLARAVNTQSGRVAGVDSDHGGAWQELLALAEAYKTVNLPDWGERVRKKDEIAAQMASLVLTRGIPRDKLAREKDEGVRMALATVITSDPRPGDENLIAMAAPGVQLKHVRYRFMMAIGRLAELKLLSPARALDFEALAIEYRKNADPSLLKRIARTLEAMAELSA